MPLLLPQWTALKIQPLRRIKSTKQPMYEPNTHPAAHIKKLHMPKKTIKSAKAAKSAKSAKPPKTSSKERAAAVKKEKAAQTK